jgi:hypothetical protein
MQRFFELVQKFKQKMTPREREDLRKRIGLTLGTS